MSNKSKSKSPVSKALVPKLRFPEFRRAQEWEERQLSDISPSIFDGTHQTPTYTTDGVPFYSVENIVSGKANKFISRDDHTIATRKNRPEKGDVLVTRIGNIGFSKVVDWEHDFSIYVTLAVIKRASTFNSLYLHSYIQSARYQTEILGNSLLNAVPCKINMDSLRKTLILLPEQDEQDKIADFFSSIDDLITAQTTKLDSLKAHKEGLLQQLFPAKDETTPKLAFSEFLLADNWKIIDLGECLIKHPEYGVNAAAVPYSSNLPTYIRITDISEDGHYLRLKRVSVDISEDNDYYLKEGDIVLARTGASVGKSYRYRSDDGLLVFAGFLIRVTPANKKLNPEYLSHFFFTETYWNWVKRTSARSGQPGINGKEFAGMPLPIPKTLEEQDSIAACLSSLDELLTALAIKLDILKNHKKGLLQQLFPNEMNIG